MSIETTAAYVNCLLQHYGTNMALMDTLTAALEHLQLEIGVKGCPLNYSFDKYGRLATNTWVKRGEQDRQRERERKREREREISRESKP